MSSCSRPSGPPCSPSSASPQRTTPHFGQRCKPHAHNKRATNMQEKRLGGGNGDPGTHRGQGLGGERCAAWPAACTRQLCTPSGPHATLVSTDTRLLGPARPMGRRARYGCGQRLQAVRTGAGVVLPPVAHLQTGSSPWRKIFDH